MRKFITVVALAIIAVTLCPGPSWAAPPLAPADVTAAQVRGIIAANPGARQIGANEVELQPGVVMAVVQKSATVTPFSASGCSQLHLCLFRDANFYPLAQYWYLRFYDCGLVNIGGYFMPNGVRWNDQVSSIDNPQSAGVISRFYNYNGFGDPLNLANDTELISLPAGHFLKNLALDKSKDGSGSPNDRIDIVRVC